MRLVQDQGLMRKCGIGDRRMAQLQFRVQRAQEKLNMALIGANYW